MNISVFYISIRLFLHEGNRICPIFPSPPLRPIRSMLRPPAAAFTHSSLIGGASADRLTNSLFINGLSVPGSQRSQRRTIQFSSIDFMSPCRAIFITGIKTLIKDKKQTSPLETEPGLSTERVSSSGLPAFTCSQALWVCSLFIKDL